MKTQKTAVKNLTIGLDLGDRRHQACVLDAAGEIVAEEVIANTREVATAWLTPYPRATAYKGGRPNLIKFRPVSIFGSLIYRAC